MEPEGLLPHSQEPATCPYPELKLYQRTSPGPRLCDMFRNVVIFYGEELLAPCPTPQAGGPPLVGCPLLLIQCIRSYPPYPEAVPPSAT
jgi:hypothetical protein